MPNRITIKTLESMVGRLNQITNSPETMGSPDANIGHWMLSQAYGGVCVESITNSAGGTSCPIWIGHIPKRDAFAMLNVFLNGLEFKS